MIRAPFSSLYNVRHEDRAAFGAAWCGPVDVLPHGETLCAVYVAPPGTDGQTAEVYVGAHPSRSYRIRVLAGANSCNEPQAGYTLSTGSGSEMREWAAMTARLIRDGMIGVGGEE